MILFTFIFIQFILLLFISYFVYVLFYYFFFFITQVGLIYTTLSHCFCYLFYVAIQRTTPPTYFGRKSFSLNNLTLPRHFPLQIIFSNQKSKKVAFQDLWNHNLYRESLVKLLSGCDNSPLYEHLQSSVFQKLSRASSIISSSIKISEKAS